jgi:hypothetical protein
MDQQEALDERGGAAGRVHPATENHARTDLERKALDFHGTGSL